MIWEHVPPQLPTKVPTPIAFVGEAPSWEEIEDGQPLVGPAGRVFNAILRTAKLERSDYLVTNVFDAKIPDNKIKNWCVSLKDARAQSITELGPIGEAGFLAKEHHAHLSRLQREIEDAHPTVIVPLGGTALWAFTGRANITQMRGTAFEATRIVPGAKLVPTFHPSFIMKNWTLYSTVVRDFQYALREALGGADVAIANRRLILEPTLADLNEAKANILQAASTSVDIETSHGQITCISFEWGIENAICVPFYDVRKPDHNYWPTPQEELFAWRFVETILASDVPIVGQNFGGYDFFWLLQKAGLQPRNFHDDTRLMHHGLYPELPKDLGFMGATFASQGAWKYLGKGEGKRDDN